MIRVSIFVRSATFARLPMTKVYTTEVTSESIPSDNPIHQRLLQAYYLALPFVKGDLLEIGCGEGRGIEPLLTKAARLMAVDRLQSTMERLRKQYPSADFRSFSFPPLSGIADNVYDTVVSFQVIEHIRDDRFFLEEIRRVLKPGGTALLSTPNRNMSLSRNPWHVREYSPQELADLASGYFPRVDVKGIGGTEKVMRYHERNRESVRKLMRWDILDLQHRLPAPILRIPYEIMNRINRNSLYRNSDELAASIQRTDYLLRDKPEGCLDLFLIVEKRS